MASSRRSIFIAQEAKHAERQRQERITWKLRRAEKLRGIPARDLPAFLQQEQIKVCCMRMFMLILVLRAHLLLQAATLIQKVTRGHLARLRCQYMRYQKRQSNAVVVLQVFRHDYVRLSNAESAEISSRLAGAPPHATSHGAYSAVPRHAAAPERCSSH